jgi:hypothetical protein
MERKMSEDHGWAVELKFPATQVQRLNWLMETGGFENRQDLFNSALSLLNWALQEAPEPETSDVTRIRRTE